MADAQLNILIRAKDEASKTFADLAKNAEGMSKTYKVAGAAMLAASTAIAVGLALCVKAAAQEQAGIERLRIAMSNVGLSYDEASKSLEGWIDKQAQTTAFADDEQRQSLSSLIALTGDLAESESLLTTAMDLARWKSIDLVTASDLIAKVYAGNSGILARYGIIVKQGATATEALTEIQRLAAGQAKAYGQTLSGQFERLRNNVGDLKEAIGAVLMPVVTRIVELINQFVQVLKNANPGLLQLGVAGGVATSALLGLGGSFLLLLGFLPNIIKGLATVNAFLTSSTAATIGFSLAVGGLITAIAIAMVGLGMLIYHIVTHERATTAGAKAQRDFIDQLERGVEVGEQENRALQRVTLSLKERRFVQQQFNIDLSRTGEATSVWSGKEKDLDAALKEASRLLDKEVDAANRLHNTRIAALDKEYAALLRNLDAETSAQTSAIQDQIDAIDKQTRDEDKILREADYQKRLNELSARIASTTDAEERARLEAEYQDMVTEHARERLLDQREAQKDALRQQIKDIQDNAQKEVDRLETELTEKKTHEDAMLKATTDRVDAEQFALANAGAIALKYIDAELVAWQSKEASELASTLARLATTQSAWQAFFTWLAEQNAAAAAGATTTPSDGGWYTPQGKATGKPLPPTYVPPLPPGYGGSPGNPTPGFQYGGVMPYTGLAFLHRGETVSPANASAEQTTHIHIEINGKELAEVVTKHLGAKLRLQKAY
jgi:hypothetical protein